MKSDDTPMWNDPAEPAYLRELLDAGRNAPVEYDAAQGLAMHLAHVKAGTPLPHWARPSAAAGMSSTALVAWVVIPVVAATVVAGLYLGTRSNSVSTPAPSPSGERAGVSALSAQGPAITPQPASPTVVAPTAVAERAQIAAIRKAPHLPRSSAEQRGDVAAKTLSGDKSANAANTVPSHSAVSGAVAARIVLHPSTTAARAAAIEPQAEVEQPAEQAVKPAVQPVPELDESRLEREMQMLAVAQRVLSEDPTRALRMAQQGEREFPNTMFSAERQQVALLAMVKLGRVDEARRVGQPFLAKYPNAPWSARLRRALATGRVE